MRTKFHGGIRSFSYNIKLIEEMSNRELMIELYMKYCLKLLRIKNKMIFENNTEIKKIPDKT